MYDWLKKLGETRDGFLLLASADYILGYLVWSIVAWKLKLGPLPVLDAQYFSAGIPILILGGIVVFVIRLLKITFLEKWPRWFKEIRLRYQLLLYIGISLFSVLPLIITLLFIAPISIYNESIFFSLLIFSFLFLVLGSLLLRPGTILDLLTTKLGEYAVSRTNKKYVSLLKYMAKLFVGYEQGAKLSNVILLPILAACVGIYFYVNTIFLLVPQEYGGAKPRCGTLDIVCDSISKDTLEELVAATPVDDDNKVMRTKKMFVFFSGKNFLLIGQIENSGITERRIELSKSAVKAIQWCN